MFEAQSTKAIPEEPFDPGAALEFITDPDRLRTPTVPYDLDDETDRAAAISLATWLRARLVMLRKETGQPFVTIAAPEMGHARRLAVLIVRTEDDEVAVTLVNPTITRRLGRRRMLESCLGTQATSYYVWRPREISLSFHRLEGGQLIETEVHLDGDMAQSAAGVMELLDGRPPEDQHGFELYSAVEKKPKPARVKAKPGPNAPCPCGSGRKYKKCCFDPANPVEVRS